MDESGTIDPAALNAPASTISPTLLSTTRGTKRSRSPDTYGHPGQETETDDGQATKRSRALKSREASSMTSHAMQHAVQTPQVKTETLPRASPNQTSPAQSTPGSGAKAAVVKALPTVRDHTTDQLGPEGDEYIARETDPDGENKVSKDGYALDGRKYRCRTFKVPNRGEKLFMLATECARVLGYRDSYLLFNKNRSLFKIIANQTEKDNLIHQEILPYSYRSRQIAIVTARSMFRQFGSRLIENGRRVRDDYWEAKARKQGFTEEDAAGEKRPGAAKAREAAAAEASHAALTSLPQGQIIYSNGPGIDGQPPPLDPVSLAPLPMIHLPGDEIRSNSFGNIVRPRQEMTGQPFQDRSQSSAATDILAQATQAAEYNKQLSQTRGHRANYLDDYWRRPHEQPVVESPPEGNGGTIAPPSLQSPQAVSHISQGRLPQEQMAHVGSQMISQSYGGYPNQQNPIASPVQPMHRPMAASQLHQGSPTMGMSSAAGSHRQTPSYGGGYGPNQMWQTPQPQQSPMSQPHHLLQQSYGQHPQPSQMLPPQMPQAGMGYPQMSPMGGNPSFPGMNRSMYQPSPNAPSQFNMPSGAGQQQSPQQQQQQPQQQQQQQQQGLPSWANTAGGANMGQDWQRFQ